jgi:arginine kinase
MWDNCKNLTDSYGFTFRKSIFRGCKNLDVIVGVIAGSHEAYSTFAEIFDPIIQDYHGHA